MKHGAHSGTRRSRYSRFECLLLYRCPVSHIQVIPGFVQDQEWLDSKVIALGSLANSLQKTTGYPAPWTSESSRFSSRILQALFVRTRLYQI